MEITETRQGELSILKLEGKLDAVSCSELDQKLLSMIDGGDNAFLLDLDSLVYISSAGLRTMLTAHKKLAEIQGRLILCALQEQVKEVFDISGFSQFFSISPSREEALAELA